MVLTGGPTHPTYVEHSYLAVQMGFHLAEGGDLVVRKNRVWLRALDGVEPVDVVYRRVEDAQARPARARAPVAAPGVPGITWAAQSGGVALANAFGTRLAEEPELAPFLDVRRAAAARRGARAAPLGPATCWRRRRACRRRASAALVPGAVVLRLQVARHARRS